MFTTDDEEVTNMKKVSVKVRKTVVAEKKMLVCKAT